MKYIISVLSVLSITTVSSHPHLYNPYYNFFRYNQPYYNSVSNYAHGIQPTGNLLQPYSPYVPQFLSNYIEQPQVFSEEIPTINVLAEVPFSIQNKFTAVPMYIVSKKNMNFVQDVEIMSVSKTKPVMTIKSDTDELKQCTPAVKIVLEKPIVTYSLKSTIVFPSEISVIYRGYTIPISVGAVIAPVNANTYVSSITPVTINVVYAIPTTPFSFDYVNNDDAVFVPEIEAVVIETVKENDELPQKNVTVLNFPNKVAEPNLQVDEEDEELVNRNPPQVLAPGGIVQSTQPESSVGPFTNSKESPVLHDLREEAKKRL